jgi:hypothetical protein
MKHLLLFCGLGFLAFHPAKAARLAAPTDTITGHAHLVRKLSQELCTKLTNDHTTKFADLTTNQAMQLTQQLFTDVMRRDSVAVLSMMEKGVQQNLPPQQVGQQLGQDVVLWLGRNCPAALPLITRLTQTEQYQRTLEAQQASAMSAAEKKVLLPIAAAVCTQLARGDAQVPFVSLLPSQREQTLMDDLEKALSEHRPQLLKYYGKAQLNKEILNGELYNKLGVLAASQEGCSQYLMLIRTKP